MALPGRSEKLVTIPLTGPLDQSQYPGRMERSKLQVAQNVVYRRVKGLGKRSGSGPDVGTGAVGSGAGILSGYRWYRGSPSGMKTTVVQSADQLWTRNDTTGAYTAIAPALSAGSSAAFYDSAYDPALSSDIMIVAYGSGPPMRWDGTTFTQLNVSISNHFTGVHTWHEHVWFWGDPNYPGVLFATDLGNPESMAYTQAFGGYPIGRGDGDPIIQRCISVGGTLYVFKTNSIYVIQGYDFSTGEYQFNVQPFARNVGIPSPKCVSALPDGTLVFWSGQNFYTIPPGASEPIPIGGPLWETIGVAAAGNQNVVRTIAGSFVVAGPGGPILYNDVFLCALDDGSGAANTICVFDQYASNIFGMPAWTVWTGLSVGAFIAYNGPGDTRRLYIGNSTASSVVQYGQNNANDSGKAITVNVETIRDDTGTPDQRKRLARAYLECESGTAQFTLNVISNTGTTNTQTSAVQAPAQGSTFGTGAFDASTFGAQVPTAYQSPVAYIEPELYGANFEFQLIEQSTTAVYELLSLSCVYYEEALPTQ